MIPAAILKSFNNAGNMDISKNNDNNDNVYFLINITYVLLFYAY